MIHEVIQYIAHTLKTDVSTMWKSIFSGTSSTGAGFYLAKINGFDWQFELNIVSLFWGAVSCILLTLLSLFVSDLYKKYIRKRIIKRKEN